MPGGSSKGRAQLVEGLFGYWWKTARGRWIELSRMTARQIINAVRGLEIQARKSPDEWFVLLWIVRLEMEASRRGISIPRKARRSTRPVSPCPAAGPLQALQRRI